MYPALTQKLNLLTFERFKPTNPGIWLFHCHIEWHIEAGLTVTFIEDPPGIQALHSAPPPGNIANCAALGIPVIGNAAGHGTLNGTGDPKMWLDLNGQPSSPEKDPHGYVLVRYFKNHAFVLTTNKCPLYTWTKC
jgi:iron transport multicopper oxidase